LNINIYHSIQTILISYLCAILKTYSTSIIYLFYLTTFASRTIYNSSSLTHNDQLHSSSLLVYVLISLILFICLYFMNYVPL